MIDSLQIFILLMTLAVLLVGLALKLRLPYPLMLVFGGIILGFVPSIDHINFDPNLVLIIVLPPTLYYAAYSISFKEFQRNINEILGLALGLVLITTLFIGLIFKGFFPLLSWPVAFTFGAIISPPDAVAATAMLRRFTISPRLMTILEGESLINDATGLILYKFGVIAVLSGFFSFADAGFEFVKITGGGILVGAITGFLFHTFSSRFFDPLLAIVYSFTIPYLTYILADSLGFSGVLAVVINGLIGSRMLISHFSSLTRVAGWAAWDILIIFLNCFVFIVIGLQLHGIVQRLTLEKAILFSGYGFLLTLATIFIRFVWVHIRKNFYYFQKQDSPLVQKKKLKDSIILSWAGMRGIVSLTIALSLPLQLPDGTPFPGRDLIIFLTFIIILLSLLIPGITFSFIIRFLSMHSTFSEQDTKNARQELVKIAQKEIQRLYALHHLDDQEYFFLLAYFNSRHQILEMTSQEKEASFSIETACLEIINKKREKLIEMWEQNQINDQLLKFLEREIDFEETHLAHVEF